MQDEFKTLQDLFDGFQRGQIVHTAVVLNIFDTIGDGAVVANADFLGKLKLAKTAADSLDHVTRIMNACVCLKLLSKEGANYKNTKLGQMLRSNNANSPMPPMFNYLYQFMPILYRGFGRLAYNIDHGLSQDTIFDNHGKMKLLEPKEVKDLSFMSEKFTKVMEMMSMKESGSLVAFLMGQQGKFKELKTFCDLGGGTGFLVAKIAEAMKNIQFIVYDKNADCGKAASKLSNVKAEIGDFFKDAIPKCDGYLLSHVLHDFDDAHVAKLLSNVCKNLSGGHCVYVFEKLLNDDRVGPDGVVIFDIGMMAIQNGRERTFSDYKELLSKSGFSKVEINDVQGASRKLIIATK